MVIKALMPKLSGQPEPASPMAYGGRHVALLVLSYCLASKCPALYQIPWLLGGVGSPSRARGQGWAAQSGAGGAYTGVSDLRWICLLWLLIPKHRRSRCLYMLLGHSLNVFALYNNATQAEINDTSEKHTKQNKTKKPTHT